MARDSEERSGAAPSGNKNFSTLKSMSGSGELGFFFLGSCDILIYMKLLSNNISSFKVKKNFIRMPLQMSVDTLVLHNESF